MTAERVSPTRRLHQLGQSLWLDNITRPLLASGTLKRYIEDLAVSGLTSNPTIFYQAFRGGDDYDDELRHPDAAAKSSEQLFFELAIADLRRAAELFLPVHQATAGVDGWVSLEVSPLLAHDTASTVAVARDLHARAAMPNLYIKIPGTPAGLPAIEEAIFAGVSVNVTLLFSPAQYLAAADAYWRGIERRLEAGLSANVSSVASLFISRWDVAVTGKVAPDLDMKLGIAVGREALRSYNELLASTRVRRAMNFGARPQRLLFASTGTKNPLSPDTLYIEGLAAPLTINTMPEATLKAFADHGTVGGGVDGTDAVGLLARFEQAGIDLDALATRLQDEGAAAFVASWRDLMKVIEAKRMALATAG